MLDGLAGLALLGVALAAGADRPLTKAELRDLGKASIWAMDVEIDGGTVPPEIDRLIQRSRSLTPKEARVVLDWFYRTAPGSFS